MGTATLSLLLFLLLPAAPQSPAITSFGVNLQWDANPETDLAGYKVYWGNSSRVYGTPVTLGKVTTYKVENLTTPGVYFFAVTAFNSTGESPYSNEVVLQPGPKGDPGPIGLTGPQGPPGPSGGVQGPITALLLSDIKTISATIAWATQQECSGKVDYGTAEPFTKSLVANNLGTTDHLAYLVGLITRTHYLYRVSGVCAGVLIQSGLRSFNTK